jgi:flagellar basal body-associated protein FliL
MTLPKGYNKSTSTQKIENQHKGRAIAVSLLLVIVIVALVAYAINWALSEDDKEFNQFASQGCVPSTSSYTGAVSSWVCPND